MFAMLLYYSFCLERVYITTDLSHFCFAVEMIKLCFVIPVVIVELFRHLRNPITSSTSHKCNDSDVGALSLCILLMYAYGRIEVIHM